VGGEEFQEKGMDARRFPIITEISDVRPRSLENVILQDPIDAGVRFQLRPLSPTGFKIRKEYDLLMLISILLSFAFEEYCFPLGLPM